MNKLDEITYLKEQILVLVHVIVMITLLIISSAAVCSYLYMYSLYPEPVALVTLAIAGVLLFLYSSYNFFKD